MKMRIQSSNNDEKKLISKIERQQRDKNRFNLFVDDQFFASIHEDIIVSLNLYKGKEVNEKDFYNILEEEEKHQIWRKSLKYLGYKARTKNEIKEYLLSKNYAIEQIDVITDKLETENLINDSVYAKNFVKDRITHKLKGKRLIIFELKNKGISEEDLEECLNEIDELAEYNSAMALVEKKLRNYQGENLEKIIQKMAGLLNRRGFSFSIINKILNELRDSNGSLDNL